MSCLPLFKHLLNFGRKISKMALKIKSNNYSVLNNTKNSLKPLALLDPEIENQSGGFYSSFSSGFVSPGLSESPSYSSLFVHANKGRENRKLQSYFDSFHLDDTASTVSSKDIKQSEADKINWKEDINSLFDPNSKQFDEFENFVQTRGFSECSLFSYSPLSSVDSISNDQNNYNDLYCNDYDYRMQQECIRLEFEMNGKYVDDLTQDEIFQPSAMSTPFVERKSDQFKLNNSLSKIKYHHPAQLATTDLQQYQFNEHLYPNPINENIPGMFQMDLNFPQLHSLVPKDDKKNKHQGKKRGHQVLQPLFIPQDHLQLMNNNPSHLEFGSAASNSKKMSKKNNGKKNKKTEDHCVFCKNNGVEESVYRSHTVRDSKGRVLCPKLRAYQCPICGADGDQSHTVKYCPQKPIITMEDLKKLELSKRLSLKHF